MILVDIYFLLSFCGHIPLIILLINRIFLQKIYLWDKNYLLQLSRLKIILNNFDILNNIKKYFLLQYNFIKKQ